jgi:hypothetical protein
VQEKRALERKLSEYEEELKVSLGFKHTAFSSFFFFSFEIETDFFNYTYTLSLSFTAEM